MLRSRFLLPALFFGLTAVGACASPTGGEDEIGSVGADLIESGTSLGELPPSNMGTGPYQGGGALFYAYEGLSVDSVTAQVTVAGDAQVSVTDAGGTVLAQSTGSGPNAQVSYTVPQGGWKELHVLFKDRSAPANGTFHVKVTATPSPACNNAPGSERWNNYQQTRPQDCEGFHITCPSASERPFHNICGCGCQEPAPG
jgi:hypothetical protein